MCNVKVHASGSFTDTRSSCDCLEDQLVIFIIRVIYLINTYWHHRLPYPYRSFSYVSLFARSCLLLLVLGGQPPRTIIYNIGKNGERTRNCSAPMCDFGFVNSFSRSVQCRDFGIRNSFLPNSIWILAKKHIIYNISQKWWKLKLNGAKNDFRFLNLHVQLIEKSYLHCQSHTGAEQSRVLSPFFPML